MNSTEPFHVVAARRAVPYDGTNSAKIAEAIGDFTVTGEDANGLTFTSGGATHTVPKGGYLDYAGGVVSAVYANDDDLGDAVTRVSAADHVHDVVLTSGGAKPMPAEPMGAHSPA